MQEYCATALHTVDPAMKMEIGIQISRQKSLLITVEERDGGVGECLRVPAGDGLALRRVARPRAVGVAHSGGVP